MAPNPALSLPVILSPTRVELTARCERRHILSDLAHRQGEKAPSAAFGDIMHSAAFAWWDGLREGTDTVTRLQAAKDALSDAWRPEAEGGYHSLELAQRMAESYAQHAVLAAGSPLPGWRIHDLEQRLFLHITDDAVLAFKLDRALIRDEDEHGPAGLLIVDTKTSSRPDGRWAAGMKRSIQQRCYNYCLSKHYGLPILEHWVEGLPKKSPGKAPVYERVDTFWTESYIQEAVSLARMSAERDRAAVGYALRQDDPEKGLEHFALTHATFNYQDCNSYYFPCPFLDVCDSSPEERGFLLADIALDPEPWQTEIREALDG